jgi:hypothetical protein
MTELFTEKCMLKQDLIGGTGLFYTVSKILGTVAQHQ